MIFATAFIILMLLGALGLAGVYDFKPRWGIGAIGIQIVCVMAMTYSIATFALRYLP